MLVAGAGGFIGGHLVSALTAAGNTVRAVDNKPISAWHQAGRAGEEWVLDVSLRDNAALAVHDCDVVYNLASDMGGMGFIERNRALCMLSVLINTHLLSECHRAGARRYFFASSACVYPAYRQDQTDVKPLQEDDVHPAMPEEGYGWEKLFSEKLCQNFGQDFGIATRIARLHNVYGTLGTFDGGREKAPAAICRKVAMAKLTGTNTIDVWGDGEQTRTFTYVDDAVVGIQMLTDSDVVVPVNVGSSELVSVNQLIGIVEDIAGVKLARTYDLAQPQGVRGRSSDNTLIRKLFDWEPSTPLRVGLEATFEWIYNQLIASGNAA